MYHIYITYIHYINYIYYIYKYIQYAISGKVKKIRKKWWLAFGFLSDIVRLLVYQSVLRIDQCQFPIQWEGGGTNLGPTTLALRYTPPSRIENPGFIY